jgi:hypothetical protein
LSEKRHFWQFISQKARKTARFQLFSYIFGGMGAHLTRFTPSTTT